MIKNAFHNAVVLTDAKVSIFFPSLVANPLFYSAKIILYQ